MESGKWQVALGRWKTRSSRRSASDALGQAMTNKQRNEVEMPNRERKKRSIQTNEANEDM